MEFVDNANESSIKNESFVSVANEENDGDSLAVDNDVNINSTDPRTSTILADHRFIKENLPSPAVLTLTHDYITVIIMYIHAYAF